MSLTATAQYKDGKTYITVKENDPSVFFVCSPVINGNYSTASNDELVDLMLDWITKKYITEYATIQLNNKINEIDKLIEEAIAKTELVTNLTNTLIKSVDLTAEAKVNIVEQYHSYEIGKKYSKGDVINYNGSLFEVIKNHTSQSDWLPDKELSLYKDFINPKTAIGETVVAEFKQPTGAHDAYKKGDKVTFNGKIYQSVISNNVYSPTAYPAGWQEIA